MAAAVAAWVSETVVALMVKELEVEAVITPRFGLLEPVGVVHEALNFHGPTD